MRVLQVGADRSKRGILFRDSPAFKRQEAYAKKFGNLDIIGFSRKNDGVDVISSGTLTVHPTNSSSRWNYMLDALRLAKKLPRPDVVSAQDPFETGFAAWLIAHHFKVPLHIQVHTDFLSEEYVRAPIDHIRRLLARFILNRAARIRVVSERVQKSLETCFHIMKPIAVLPIFADVQRMQDAPPDAVLAERFKQFKTKLLVVSRLESEKNVELAIRSFAQTHKSDLWACLIIVGDGSEKQRLEASAKELDVSGRVFFEGERDAAAYYKLADVVLVPSKYEGYGLVIIEALAAGKPVLSTDVGIAREAGAIVTTSDKFAGALADWFKNGPRTGELKNYPYKNFDEYVEKYCNDIAACVR